MKYALTQAQLAEKEKLAANPPATPLKDWNFTSNRWPDKAIEMLERIWPEGHSASKCAAMINHECGTNFTRNAVIGRVHRHIKLAPRGVSSTSLTRFQYKGHKRPNHLAAKPAAPQKIKASGPKLEIVKPPRPSLVEPLAPLLQPDGHPRAIAEGPGRLCSWIEGDPKDLDAAFCGRDKRLGSSFCEAHHHRAYTQLTPRQTAQRAEGAAKAGGQLRKLAW